ncbi:hypothetical protein NDU88_001517 [Pleurodeles waltl]|uniref:Secreted protein n=1 Tax=Pleurodeles waltl TaxID=8319 RepID=A0AAV7SBV0_PLEWA|nr:hypothetical protein NDU88_001517 [Pleurodeles waltl]
MQHASLLFYVACLSLKPLTGTSLTPPRREDSGPKIVCTLLLFRFQLALSPRGVPLGTLSVSVLGTSGVAHILPDTGATRSCAAPSPPQHPLAPGVSATRAQVTDATARRILLPRATISNYGRRSNSARPHSSASLAPTACRVHLHRLPSKPTGATTNTLGGTREVRVGCRVGLFFGPRAELTI